VNGGLRPTIRLRLTLIYAAMFFVTGAILLTMMYVLVDQALKPPDRPGGPGPDPHAMVQASPSAGQEFRDGLPQSEAELESRLDAAREEQRAEALRQVQIQAAIALVVTSIGALGLGWYFSGRMLRPIHEITLHAQHLSESTLGQRIALSGPDDELKQLADTIDLMLERLERAFESQRRFAAQASHELRTPIAIMGAEADIVLDAPDASARETELAKSVRAQATRSERLVSGLLVLARSESTMRENDRVDLADLAGDVIGEQVTDADAAHVRVDLELESAETTGDAVLLKHLIGNMVSNAIRYNHDGGFVRIEARREGGMSCVRVSNTGPIVEPDDLDRLFHPFQRGMDVVSRREGGFGLGLAIIRSVTAVHSGELHATPRPEGGLVLTVCLPTAEELKAPAMPA
jgi:signal transduction histidine kinase